MKPHRRDFGEAVENLTSSYSYHWMAGNFVKYGAEGSVFGRRDAGDLPVDAHAELIALCAPRPVFISYGIPERATRSGWTSRGRFRATVAAGAFTACSARRISPRDRGPPAGRSCRRSAPDSSTANWRGGSTTRRTRGPLQHGSFPRLGRAALAGGGKRKRQTSRTLSSACGPRIAPPYGPQVQIRISGLLLLGEADVSRNHKAEPSPRKFVVMLSLAARLCGFP